MLSAASMIRMVLGTCAFTPSIVMLTVSTFWLSGMYQMLSKRAHTITDVRDVFVTEFLNRARDRRGRRIAQHADGGSGHVLPDIEQRIHILFTALPVFDAAQNLREPLRAFAARRALPARLVCVEVHHAAHLLHHARLIVHDDHR